VTGCTLCEQKKHNIDLDPNQPLVEIVPTKMRQRGLLTPPGNRLILRAAYSKQAKNSGTVYLPLELIRPHPCPGGFCRFNFLVVRQDVR